MRRRNFVTARFQAKVGLFEGWVSGSVKGNVILGLCRKHIQHKQFDVGLCPFFRVERVCPDVRQLMQGGVVVFRAERNDLIVQVCLAKFVMIFRPATSRWHVMMKV